MKVFISTSKGKSLRKTSKTLKKGKTKRAAAKKKGSFHRMSRRSQILYIKRHPGSKYTMKDVKPKKRGEKDPEVKQVKRKPRKAKEVKEEVVDEKELDQDTGPDDSSEDETLDEPTETEDAPDEEDAEIDEDVEESETEDDEARVEKAETLISKIDKVKHRAKSIAKAVRRKSKKKEIDSTLEDINDTREGLNVPAKKRANTLKTIGKIALIGLAVAGGAALYSQMGPVGLVIAKDFMSQLMWDSNPTKTSKSSNRNDLEFVELTKSVLDFITNMDKEELAQLLKQAETKKKL